MKSAHQLLLASLLLPLAVQAAPLKVDPARSSVSAVFKQISVPIEAKFRQFNAQIDYDAKHPESARAQVTLNTASLDLGDADYKREVGKKEWFNTAQFPRRASYRPRSGLRARARSPWLAS